MTKIPNHAELLQDLTKMLNLPESAASSQVLGAVWALVGNSEVLKIIQVELMGANNLLKYCSRITYFDEYQ